MSSRSRHRQSRLKDVDVEDNFPIWKTGLILGIVAVCFAILWPKVFQPLLLYILGFSGKSGDADNDLRQSSHGPPFPHMAGGIPRGPMVSDPASLPQGSGGGPHPGLRAAAHISQGQNKSSGRGFASNLLPMYSVAVIIFLLYMLSKVFFKNTDKSSRRRRTNNLYRRRLNLSDNSSGEELDANLMKASSRFGGNGVMSNRHLNSLQSRLNDTEKALSHILTQLSVLGEHIDEETVESVRQMTESTLADLKKEEATNAQEPETLVLHSEHNQEELSPSSSEISLEGSDRCVDQFKPIHSDLDDPNNCDNISEQLEEEDPADQLSEESVEDDDDDNKHANINNGYHSRLGNNDCYIPDLERALSDFQRFTESYVTEHMKAAKQSSHDAIGEYNAVVKRSDKLNFKIKMEEDKNEKTLRNVDNHSPGADNTNADFITPDNHNCIVEKEPQLDCSERNGLRHRIPFEGTEV